MKTDTSWTWNNPWTKSLEKNGINLSEEMETKLFEKNSDRLEIEMLRELLIMAKEKIEQQEMQIESLRFIADMKREINA